MKIGSALGRLAVVIALATATPGGPASADDFADDKGAQPEYTIKDHPGALPFMKVPAPTFPFKPPAATIAELTYVGTAYIVNDYTHDGKLYCLDAHSSGGGAPNSPVGLWECNGGPTTAWHVYGGGGVSGFSYRFINYQWNRALDYPAASNGANFWQYGVYDYVDSLGQRFRTEPRPGNWEIAVQLGGMANLMDAYGTQAGNGTRVLNGPYSGHLRQRWRFCWLDTGKCT
ncbi:hypothetical protein ABZ897_24270 [Nonomuraea sp. NPDC046802]|uniref:RICIN domain-containing protein n=1 Tax=Nonomuraea sp. NPDC046802 TaxID=3154919 RepID=UPI0033F485AE